MLESRRETLQTLQRILMEPAKSEDDMMDMRRELRGLEGEADQLNQRVAEQQRAAGDSKLAMFRQQGSMVAKSLQQLEEQLDASRQAAEKLRRDIEAKEAKMREICGPRYIPQDASSKYAEELRQKTQEFKVKKMEIAAIRDESVVLARTEQILKSRATNVEEFMQKLESQRGIAGYTGTQVRARVVVGYI